MRNIRIQLKTDYKAFQESEQSGMPQESLDLEMSYIQKKAKKYGLEDYLGKLINREIKTRYASITTDQAELERLKNWLRKSRGRLVNNRQENIYDSIQRRYENSKTLIN